MREQNGVEAIHARMGQVTDGPGLVRLQLRIGGKIESAKLKYPVTVELGLIDGDSSATREINGFLQSMSDYGRNKSPQVMQALEGETEETANLQKGSFACR